MSLEQTMPEELPERVEAGTVNVPGIAGLCAGMEILQREGIETIGKRERRQVRLCARGLEKMGFRIFAGEHQSGTLSFLPEGDCEEAAQMLAGLGIAVRAGLHCAPLAHESAGTLAGGTVRLSFGYTAHDRHSKEFLHAAASMKIRRQ